MFRLTGNDTRCPLPDTDLSQGHLLPELCPSTAGIPTVILLGEGGGGVVQIMTKDDLGEGMGGLAKYDL